MLLVMVAAIASADPAPAGFDHYVHDRNLFAGGKDPVPCARCHIERAGHLIGKPDHAACFGACHGPRPVAPARGAKLHEPDRIKVCAACHAETALSAPYAGTLAVGYPPYKTDPDFRLAIGHNQHRDVACTQCHADPEHPHPGVAHARCLGCHDGTKSHGPGSTSLRSASDARTPDLPPAYPPPSRGPAMSACGGCHPAASGSPLPPQLRAVHNTVTSTFSHGKHAARGGAGKDCATCHAAIRNSDDPQLPRPTVAECATSGCHDGVRAFATTVDCTRCHARPPFERFDVERPALRFVHGGSHASLFTDLLTNKPLNKPCLGCHPVSAHGEVVVGGHASCTGTNACHDDDFGKRKPRICGACHNATEPWRHLVADRAPPEVTEFGATLDHRKHPAACTSCHKLRTSTAQLRAPRGHAACTTKGCHAVARGPSPQLETCVGCHELGLTVARTAKRVTAPWSVRTKFDHVPHGGSAGACNTCHVDLTAARVIDLAPPSKPTCAPCHDGQAAFKVTGTQCTRCHVGAT